VAEGSEVVAAADGGRLLLQRAGGVAVLANLHSLSSCLTGDEISCQCNLEVTTTAPYSESAESNPNYHAPLLQDLVGRHYVACRKLSI
jgi:hypothetical protein